MNSEVTIFLRNLAQDIESDKLNPEQLQNVSDFYMTYKFEQKLNTEKESRKELLSFLALGWYIHNMLK